MVNCKWHYDYQGQHGFHLKVIEIAGCRNCDWQIRPFGRRRAAVRARAWAGAQGAERTCSERRRKVLGNHKTSANPICRQERWHWGEMGSGLNVSGRANEICQPLWAGYGLLDMSSLRSGAVPNIRGQPLHEDTAPSPFAPSKTLMLVQLKIEWQSQKSEKKE